MIRTGVIGGSGYTGGELIRILLGHPGVRLEFVFSSTRAGRPLHQAHPDLLGRTELCFTDQPDLEVDAVFLCLGHGNSGKFLSKWAFGKATRVIDLSNEFRLEDHRSFRDRDFVYGLPEYQKAAIREARNIANPGCFATALQLALLPLASKGMLSDRVHVNAITGSTGAGAGLSETTHFSWRNNNLSWYKPFTHQHLGEVLQSLEALQQERPELLFLPLRGNFSRGIFATAYTRFDGSLEEAKALYATYYQDARFTMLTDQPPTLKQVVNTNAAHLHLHKHEQVLLVTSVIDNLLKGASGQAVQNMNLMFGLPEDTGLQLKGIGF
ncbi:MAG: N-acetyl-gamma-glutamyl-phosphate reductase [Robiginitalea sp.]|nr:N-acetyl-gamma-glutamyl-phosphate reductase [Robiginitalea sp.]